MKVTSQSSELWKNCIGAISNLIDEAAFRFTSDGVRMEAMDPSHVALVDFSIPSSSFEEYEVGKNQVLGVDLIEMDKVVSRAKKNDKFTIELDEDKNRLELKFEGASTRRFSLPLIEVEEEEPPQPELDFTSSAKVQAGIVQDGLKDASLVTDNVRFVMEEGKFMMKTESDTGSSEMELAKDSEGLEKLEVKESSNAMYNIGYLEDMLKAVSSNDFIEVSLGQDIPIKLDFSIGGDGGQLKFLLAPRIEAEQ
ncbi:MAG: proliferating cell nuclear antigen (pcna) [Hadesarchaea archaeon]|nr:proliferating cell nuclear antigen (pcna) [Hadesarchaea archaeon]